MEFTYENEAGEEVTVTFPTYKEVCHECDGHGTHLCEGMKGAAYTAEEFAESFDDEDRQEYFRHGGKYDVTCTVCHGKNVVDEIDEEQCQNNPELKEALEAYYENEAAKAQDRQNDMWERRFCG